jgi:hypothetical protein
VREVLTGRSVVLLLGGLAIGALSTPAGYDAVTPLFVALFPGVLVLFLLDLGVLAGRRLRDVPAAGPGLVVAALVIRSSTARSACWSAPPSASPPVARRCSASSPGARPTSPHRPPCASRSRRRTRPTT